MVEGEIVPVGERVVVACSPEKAKEMSRAEAKTEGMTVEYEEGWLRVTWEEGLQQKVLSLLSRLWGVCCKGYMLK